MSSFGPKAYILTVGATDSLVSKDIIDLPFCLRDLIYSSPNLCNSLIPSVQPL